MGTTMAPASAPSMAGRSRSRRLGTALKGWWRSRRTRRLENLAILRLRAMSDRELEEKFLDQAQAVLPASQVRDLIALCWKIGELGDMRQFVEAAVPR